MAKTPKGPNSAGSVAKSGQLEGKSSQPIDHANLKALASFAPRFRDPSAEFGKMKATVTDPDGSEILCFPHVELSELGKQFFDMCYNQNWVMFDFDAGNWINTEEAQLLIQAPQNVGQASLQTLRQLLTSLIRQERFSDGRGPVREVVGICLGAFPG